MDWAGKLVNGRHPTQRYRQVQVETAAKDDLLILLLDGGVKFAEGGLIELQKGADEDCDRRNDLLLRAQKIVLELMGALSPVLGLELYERLQSLYKFTLTRLFQGNVESNVELVAEGVEVLQQIRDMWKEAVEQARAEKKSGPERPPSSSTISVTG